MKRLILLLALLATSVSVPAQPAKILILRHAEKITSEGDEAGLSTKGEERAAALVPYMTQNRGFIKDKEATIIFATKITGGKGDNHTHETMGPLAERLGLKINSPYSNADYKNLVRFITTDPSCKDKTVVICWTHAYIPKLVAALGIESNLGDWDKNVFDRILVVTGSPGSYEMINLPQRLLFGDTTK